ncbi:SMI1/KNR4 family protein [Eubacterium sp. AB3007]|uniref:SMI1/KNR4 family protein n=1 Tax=Eubacterium sp. AB3007 TaxID=1392487 RepID=UPI000558CD89|nr:SMI1/KNR4 family protein [Eubacterium sp. AB3007]
MVPNLVDIVEQLKMQGKMFFLEGATEQQIEAFERQHEISFPEQYKEWLKFSDGGECFLPAGIQLYGVAHKPLIDVNDNDRPNDDYIVIGRLASGDPILWRTRMDRIVIFNHEDERIEPDEVYTNFFSFVNDLHSLLGIGG